MIITNCNNLLREIIELETYIQKIEETLSELDIEYDKEEILKLIISQKIRRDL